jgi:hypothetical protein
VEFVVIAALQLLLFRQLLIVQGADPFITLNGLAMRTRSAVAVRCCTKVAHGTMIAEPALPEAWALTYAVRCIVHPYQLLTPVKELIRDSGIEVNNLSIELVIVLVHHHIQRNRQAHLSHVDIHLNIVFKLGVAHTLGLYLLERFIRTRFEFAQCSGALGQVGATYNHTITAPAKVTFSVAYAELITLCVLLVHLATNHQQHCNEASFLKVPTVEQA